MASMMRRLDVIKHKKVDDEKYHTGVHSILTALFFLLMLGFIVTRIVLYVDRPEVETFSLQLASAYAGIKLNVFVECFGPYECGDASIDTGLADVAACRAKLPGSNTDALPITIVNNTANGGLDGDLIEDLALCYDDANGGVTVTFNNVGAGAPASTAPYGQVTITSGDLQEIVQLERWHKKTVVLGLSVQAKDGEAPVIDPFFNNLQYDGRNQAGGIASLNIRLHQFANVFTVERPGSWLQVLSDIGGAAGLLLGLLRALTLFVPYQSCTKAVNTKADDSVEMLDA